LLDFDGDLSDTVLDVAFLERLRGEVTSATREELLAKRTIGGDPSREFFEDFASRTWPLLG
jgi:FAD synthase